MERKCVIGPPGPRETAMRALLPSDLPSYPRQGSQQSLRLDRSPMAHATEKTLGLLCDLREKHRADLFVVMERKCVIGPPGPRETAMRALLPSDLPSYPRQGSQQSLRKRALI